MATLLATYKPVIETLNADVIAGYRPGFFPWSKKTPIYLPDSVREQYRKFNAETVTTANAVNVAFTGRTVAERKDWLLTRVKAIDARLTTVKSRVTELLQTIGDNGDSFYNTGLQLVNLALQLVPGIGSISTALIGRQNQAEQLSKLQLQQKVQEYAAEINQLAAIRTDLTKELQALENRALSELIEPTNEAPTANGFLTVGLAAGGIGLLAYMAKNRKR